MHVIDSDKHCHGRDTIQCLKTAGIKVIFRYYARAVQPDYPQKILRRDEAVALTLAGFSLGVCYQYKAHSDDKFSEDMGRSDGEFAREYAAETIKQPANSAIYFGVDYDPLNAVLENRIVPHFASIAAVMKEAKDKGYPYYQVGVYGAWQVCDRLSKAGLVKYAWLSNSTGWGDHDGRRNYVASKKWTLLQELPHGDLCGVDHDPNEVQGDKLGQFTVPAD